MSSKKSKESVNYSLGKMSSKCGNCQYYLGNNTCEKVAGRILPNMWCKLFKKKNVK